MPEKDVFSDLRKAKEDEFFRNQEQVLLERLQQRGVTVTHAKNLGDALGTRDEEILKDLQALGYSPETIELLYAVPLIAVAWADGDVSERERSLIQELTKARPENDPAVLQLQRWLTTKPPQEFLDRSLRIIGALLNALPAEQRSQSADLLARTTQIAQASGGFLGLGAISGAERALIERVAQQIQSAHPQAARTITEQR